MSYDHFSYCVCSWLAKFCYSCMFGMLSFSCVNNIFQIHQVTTYLIENYVYLHILSIVILQWCVVSIKVITSLKSLHLHFLIMACRKKISCWDNCNKYQLIILYLWCQNINWSVIPLNFVFLISHLSNKFILFCGNKMLLLAYFIPLTLSLNFVSCAT